MKKQRRSLALTLVMFMLMFIMPISVFATDINSNEISLETTLKDGVTLKSSKKTFDVIARLNGKKIPSKVTLNGEKVKHNWNDSNKTSYTLKFNQEGENKIVVSASSGDKIATKSYNITYKKVAKGELIGYATWSVEALTIGRGFIIDPIKVPIYEGENSAQTLHRILTENGYSYEHTGRLEDSFYLSMIGDGGALCNGCIDAEKGKKLNAPINIEDKVHPNLKAVLDKSKRWPPDELGDSECLGEFDYTYMSGWMYAINNVFPNVGFSGSYLADGDVVRVQFTLFGYGADIGGSYAMGGESTDFYKVANKDKLMTLLANINSSKDKEEILSKEWIKDVYYEAVAIATKLDSTQKSVDEIYFKLDKVIKTIY